MTRQQQRTISESSTTSESSTDIEAFLLKKEHCSRAGQRSCSVSSRSMAVASLVISILCLLTVLGCGCWVFVFGKEKFWDPRSKATSEKVCLPCIQVNPHPLGEAQTSFSDGLEVRHDAGSDVKLCCANSIAQYAVLFKLVCVFHIPNVVIRFAIYLSLLKRSIMFSIVLYSSNFK